MGKQSECVFCHKHANAYRLESDGSKTYLCLDHIPVTEQVAIKKEAAPVAFKKPKQDKA
jgi:hypothetical protein